MKVHIGFPLVPKKYKIGDPGSHHGLYFARSHWNRDRIHQCGWSYCHNLWDKNV